MAHPTARVAGPSRRPPRTGTRPSGGGTRPPGDGLDLDALADVVLRTVPGADRAGISVLDPDGTRRTGTAGPVTDTERAALTRMTDDVVLAPCVAARRVRGREGARADVLVAVGHPTTPDDDARLDAVAELLRGWLAEAGAETAATHLEQALEHARLLGRAIGLTMAQRGLATDEAVAYLRALSNGTNTRLRDIATDLLRTHEEQVAHGHDLSA